MTGSPTEFAGYPAGWRAMQLPDSNVDVVLPQDVRPPDRIVTCECERNAEPSVVQVFAHRQRQSLNDKLQSPANRMSRLLAENTTDENLLEGLYLAALSRLPDRC